MAAGVTVGTMLGDASRAAEPPSTASPEPTIAAGQGIDALVSVADFHLAAQRALPKITFEYIESGSADQVTAADNTAAFRKLKLLPPLLTGVATTNLETTALGQKIAMPILLSPVAAQRMYHPHGALASARAAAAAGTIFGVSSSATNSIEEIAAASTGPKWYQLYTPKDRTIAARMVHRAEEAGYRAIVVTVDLGEWKDSDRRNRFALPHAMLLKHLRDAGFTGIDESTSYADLVAFNSQAWDLAMSWDIFDWLRKQTKLPLVIKGVLRPDDARRAVDLGLDGIVVSNHGGRRLDTMPATIDVLAQIAETVAGRAELYLDSGIRRGTDVLKALALGARAVLIGRPYVWGLAVGGEAGVDKVLKILRDELENAMLACGCATVADVDASLILK